MAFLYGIYLIYITAVCFFIDADYTKGNKTKFFIKVLIGILYLAIAIFALMLNRVGGKLVALSHFKWIFTSMLLLFYSDICSIWADNKNSLMISQASYFISIFVLGTYYLSIVYDVTSSYITTNELAVFAGALIVLGLLYGIKSLKFSKSNIIIYLVILSSAFTIAKASSLIRFMNTSFSWPMFLGSFLISISNVIILNHNNKNKLNDKSNKFDFDILDNIDDISEIGDIDSYDFGETRSFKIGLYNLLHFIGIVILPLGIYYI